MTRKLSVGIALLGLVGCKGWTDDSEETGDPIPVDSDSGDTEKETGDTDTDTDTGEPNRPPSPPEITITPEEPVESNDLNCVVTKESVDPEGQELRYSFAWTVDGQDPEISTATVSADNTWAGQEWTCNAWSSDGKHESDVVSASVLVTEQCSDTGPGEPNESESEALDLGELADNEDPKSFSAVLAGETDKDWFFFVGRDKATGLMETGITIDSGGAPVRVCYFAQCLNGLGKTEIECKNSATATTSPNGLPGCCSYASFDMDLNCADTSSDDAAMYIHAYSDMPDICQPYEIGYSY